MYTSQVDISKESAAMSPKRNRKKKPGEEDINRCKCQRSNCLKLYCDCFSAGEFCADICGCRDCYNRPRSEDAVTECKEMIIDRNPLAFAPKIVFPNFEFQNDSGEGEHMIMTAARHRVGCNCRKSMCSKKYCECFKAGVGCTPICRCEGCTNMFGRKDGSYDTDSHQAAKYNATLRNAASGEINDMECFSENANDLEYKSIGSERYSYGGKQDTEMISSEAFNPMDCQTGFSPFTPFMQSSHLNNSEWNGNNVPMPSLAPGASVSSSYICSGSFPTDSISDISIAMAGQGISAFSSSGQFDESGNKLEPDSDSRPQNNMKTFPKI